MKNGCIFASSTNRIAAVSGYTKMENLIKVVIETLNQNGYEIGAKVKFGNMARSHFASPILAEGEVVGFAFVESGEYVSLALDRAEQLWKTGPDESEWHGTNPKSIVKILVGGADWRRIASIVANCGLCIAPSNSSELAQRINGYVFEAIPSSFNFGGTSYTFHGVM